MNPSFANFTADRLSVSIDADRQSLGRRAAKDAATHLSRLIARQNRARIICACAPSQNEFLAEIALAPGIDWSRVTVFHMDEYVGIVRTHPASFRNYLATHLTDRVRPAEVHELRGDAEDLLRECRRYAALLKQAPIDAVFMGIGENGHIAFNDPSVANFNDPEWTKVATLDPTCRRQQVHDRCFPRLDAVPTQALTLTVPALMSGARLFCIVPGERKATAVAATVKAPITAACPATVLRMHPQATLYLDQASACGLPHTLRTDTDYLRHGRGCGN